MSHRALITGASSGIGEAYARALAREGHPLLLVARRSERLERLAGALARAHGVTAEVLVADLSEERGVARVERAIQDGPALELLINNAGFGTRGYFVDVAADRLLDQARLHVLAPLRLSRAALPAMVQRGRGALINVSSLGSFFPSANYVGYAASKAYLNAFTLALHDELRESGVHVQVICPGLTRTEFVTRQEYEFSYDGVPDWAWMSAEAVVRRSLATLGTGQPMVIPGLHNRLLVRAMHTPGVRWLVARAVEAAGIEY